MIFAIQHMFSPWKISKHNTYNNWILDNRNFKAKPTVISGLSSLLTRGHHPCICFISKIETKSLVSLLLCPGNWSRVHFLAVFAGFGIEVKFSCKFPNEYIIQWIIIAINNLLMIANEANWNLRNHLWKIDRYPKLALVLGVVPIR